jgi:hypothetical protein
LGDSLLRAENFRKLNKKGQIFGYFPWKNLCFDFNIEWIGLQHFGRFYFTNSSGHPACRPKLFFCNTLPINFFCLFASQSTRMTFFPHRSVRHKLQFVFVACSSEPNKSQVVFTHLDPMAVETR